MGQERRVDRGGLTRPRLLLVYLLLAATAGGQLWDLLAFTEHWPFSRYAMFSRAEIGGGRSRTRLVVYGVRADGGELPLVAPAYLAPFDAHRLDLTLANLSGVQPEGKRDILPARPERLRPALADLLRRYEARRQAGRHGGPPLVGLRLYAVSEPRSAAGGGPAVERRRLAEVGQ